jgi:hypothetical protein
MACYRPYIYNNGKQKDAPTLTFFEVSENYAWIRVECDISANQRVSLTGVLKTFERRPPSPRITRSLFLEHAHTKAPRISLAITQGPAVHAAFVFSVAKEQARGA